MDLFRWIETELNPVGCLSDQFIYDDMDSQSGRCLPIIYRPFDGRNRSHWTDRGAMLDFLCSVGGGTILDFGPGDGWPSLIMAPFINKVIGLDSSFCRVEECRNNASRLGLDNAEFIHVESESRLSFPDNSFDGITAASSIEQTPDPKQTLAELYRVLKPGGKLRLTYEALGVYRGGREQEASLWPVSSDHCCLLLYDRNIDSEICVMYSIEFDKTKEQLEYIFSAENESKLFKSIGTEELEKLRGSIIGAKKCTLRHPSGKTLVRWLKDIGFGKVKPTNNGIELAGQFFDSLSDSERPTDIETIDKILRPAIEAYVITEALIDNDPWITAEK